MHKQTPCARAPFQKLVSRCMPGAAAFLATVMALPSSAGIVLPDEPLTTGARIPPNVLFVLDNSGSMREATMPDSIANITGINFKTQTYVRNVIYYNPNTNYLPWVDSTGAVMTGGTAYNAAYSDPARVAPFETTTIDLSGATQTYYVPKTPTDTGSFTNAVNYWRYQILTSGTVERSSWDGTRTNAIVPPGYPATGLSGSGNAVVYPLTVVNLPANAVNLVIEATNAGNAYLYVHNGAVPTTTVYTQRVNTTAATKTITRTIPAATPAAQWYIGLSGRTAAGFSGVNVRVSYQLNTDRCTGGGWTGCTNATPTGRSDAAELSNFATWYSYHRTRFKVAKAGAGRAFANIGTNYRVGYRNIWNDVPISNTVIPGGGNWPVGGRWNTHPITRAKPIPVTRNNGLFDDPNGSTGANNNRTAWYQRLYSQDGSNSTPLRKALWDSGNYFATDTSNTGPWGPEPIADQYACRQSFTILTTDGYRNDDADNTAGFDYTGVGQQVGEQDSVAGNTITSPSGASFTYSPGTPYTSAHSNTLADIAMYYWKTDLRSDLANIVQPSTANPAFWQHMTTFAISIGAAGTLNPATDLPNIVAGTPWPQPLNLQPTSIDDLWHASVNGRGSFSIATDPESFSTALESALSDIAERTGSFSNVASNSTSLDAGTRVFQATYLSGVWTGELYSYAVSAAGGVDVNYDWRASDHIPVPDDRVIMTYNGTAGAAFPTAAQTTALARTASPAVSGADNVAYIKGDQSLEIANGGTLRTRGSRLGDIVSSSPTFSSDTGTIYIGANDGMLHAFDVETGIELFAYVPRGIDLGNLSTISNPSYSHRYFVDGPSVVSTRKQTPGQNILAGTLGKGGKGVFALDVTDPESFAASNVLWERNETPGGNMGLVQGTPVIATLNDGTKALIVSNGLNSSHDRAVLLVYNLATGALLTEIDTGAGSSVTPNGLSAPVGWDADGNGTLDYVYAGDLLGNVWKFDLSSALSSVWDVANSGEAMFTATRSGVAQPITGGLTVALDPKTFKTWVFFGTGRLMTAGDLISDAVESMYGLIDTGAVTERTDLTQRQIQAVGTRNGLPVRGFEENQALPVDSSGWYIDLLTPPDDLAEGERIVSDAQVVGNVLVTSSVIPTADACQTDGKGYLNALDAFTGTSLTTPFFDINGDGDFSDETIEDADGNPVAVGSVNLGVGMPTMANLLRGLAVLGGSSGGTGTLRTADPRNVGRVSWREARGD